MNLKITIKAYRAIDDLDTCIRYLQGHRKVLEDHGFTHFKTNTEEWMYNPNVYVLVAEEKDTGILVGGIRVQIADYSTILPTERALGKIDPRVISYIRNRIPQGICELCGLWNAKEVAGKRVSVLLTRAAVAITTQLPVQIMFAFLARYTRYIIFRMGFHKVDELGNNGDFFYPNDKFIANIFLNEDLSQVSHAEKEDRIRILQLRNQPHQNFTESENGNLIDVLYDLKFT